MLLYKVQLLQRLSQTTEVPWGGYESVETRPDGHTLTHFTKRYLTKKQVEKLQRENNEFDDSFQWVITPDEKLLLHPSNLFVIKTYKQFYRDDIMGKMGTFFCRPCNERLTGYCIRQYHDETNLKNNTLLVSFCFTCESIYFLDTPIE